MANHQQLRAWVDYHFPVWTCCYQLGCCSMAVWLVIFLDLGFSGWSQSGCWQSYQLQVDENQLYNRFKYLRRKEPGHSRHKNHNDFIHHPLSASHSPPSAAPVPLAACTPPCILPTTPDKAPGPGSYISSLQPLDQPPVIHVTDPMQTTLLPITDDEMWSLMQAFLAVPFDWHAASCYPIDWQFTVRNPLLMMIFLSWPLDLGYYCMQA